MPLSRRPHIMSSGCNTERNTRKTVAETRQASYRNKYSPGKHFPGHYAFILLYFCK